MENPKMSEQELIVRPSGCAVYPGLILFIIAFFSWFSGGLGYLICILAFVGAFLYLSRVLPVIHHDLELVRVNQKGIKLLDKKFEPWVEVDSVDILEVGSRTLFYILKIKLKRNSKVKSIWLTDFDIRSIDLEKVIQNFRNPDGNLDISHTS